MGGIGSGPKKGHKKRKTLIKEAEVKDLGVASGNVSPISVKMATNASGAAGGAPALTMPQLSPPRGGLLTNLDAMTMGTLGGNSYSDTLRRQQLLQQQQQQQQALHTNMATPPLGGLPSGALPPGALVGIPPQKPPLYMPMNLTMGTPDRHMQYPQLATSAALINNSQNQQLFTSPPMPLSQSPFDIYTKATQAAKFIRDQTHVLSVSMWPVLIICGSGLANLAQGLNDNKVELDYSSIPYFASSTVEGHPSKLVFGFLRVSPHVPVVAMVGRLHYYEGYEHETITFPLRVLK